MRKGWETETGVGQWKGGDGRGREKGDRGGVGDKGEVMKRLHVYRQGRRE